MKRLINRLGSVRLYSVCPMDLQQRRHATGLLLNAQRAGGISMDSRRWRLAATARRSAAVYACRRSVMLTVVSDVVEKKH